MYSKKTHKAMANALREAKLKLWDGKTYKGYTGKTTYVCRALRGDVDIVVKTENWIGSLLFPDYTLREYIESRTGEHYSSAQMQAIRQEFIDYLINVLES